MDVQSEYDRFRNSIRRWIGKNTKMSDEAKELVIDLLSTRLKTSPGLVPYEICTRAKIERQLRDNNIAWDILRELVENDMIDNLSFAGGYAPSMEVQITLKIPKGLNEYLKRNGKEWFDENKVEFSTVY